MRVQSMKAAKIILMAVALCWVATASAEDSEDKYEKWGPKGLKNSGWIFRIGGVIGGTSPIPLPAEIRGIEGFKPLGGFTFGADYYQMFSLSGRCSFLHRRLPHESACEELPHGHNSGRKLSGG